MCNYTIASLEQCEENDDLTDATNYFAKSDLPNSFFLKQFTGVGEYYKSYWKGFAMVLVQRGLPKICDVKNDILIWFQDINWPGNEVIVPFVKQNIILFRDSFAHCFKQAIKEKDETWYNTLWMVLIFSLKISEFEKETLLEKAESMYAGQVATQKLSAEHQILFDNVYKKQH